MRLFLLAVVGAVLVSAGNLAQAAEDATGTWKWTMKFREREREVTLKLTADGEKLTGGIVRRNNEETPIEEGTFKGDEVSFKVTREREGRKFTSKYTGKVSGDTIKGQIEFERQGQTRTRPWEATRAQ